MAILHFSYNKKKEWGKGIWSLSFKYVLKKVWERKSGRFQSSKKSSSRLTSVVSMSSNSMLSRSTSSSSRDYGETKKKHLKHLFASLDKCCKQITNLKRGNEDSTSCSTNALWIDTIFWSLFIKSKFYKNTKKKPDLLFLWLCKIRKVVLWLFFSFFRSRGFRLWKYDRSDWAGFFAVFCLEINAVKLKN